MTLKRGVIASEAKQSRGNGILLHHDLANSDDFKNRQSNLKNNFYF
jgi:hypothetical protein